MTPEEHIKAALLGLGFDADPEMQRTPEQVSGFLREFLPTTPLPVLEPLPTGSRDLLVLRDIPFHSLCAHHLLPFFGTATLAYLPDGRICGLGGLARLVDALARRPQLQERLAAQIANEILAGLQPRGVAVRLRARHMCMEMRGARSRADVECTATRGDAGDSLIDALRA